MTTKADTPSPGTFPHPRTEACARCRFWRPEDRHTVNPPPANFDPNSDDIGHGLCRRRPPVFVPQLLDMAIRTKPSFGRQIDREDAITAIVAEEATYYPGTYKTDWCGDFDWQLRFRPNEMPC